MLVTKTNAVKKPSGTYFYTYIPTEVSGRLGLKPGNEYLMWNLVGSRVEIVGFPLEQAKQIIAQQQPIVQQPQQLKKKVFIKPETSTELDLL